jgi:BirA family biotin operon repressor/biotin-[acetyl-CoA-carboxylase] ligase
MDTARGFSVRPGEAALVMTERQPQGRGRQGRSWVAPSAGFLGTFIFTTGRQVNALGGFSLAAGVAVYEVLRELGCHVGLKWPNDLLTPDGRKIGGILVELVPSGDLTTVLTGVGVNLAGEPQGVAGVTSVETLGGTPIAPPDFAIRLAEKLWSIWLEFEAHGLETIRHRWLEVALYVGDVIGVDLGQETVRGVFTGIDSIGRMVLDDGGTARVVAAGHIVERPGL